MTTHLSRTAPKKADALPHVHLSRTLYKKSPPEVPSYQVFRQIDLVYGLMGYSSPNGGVSAWHMLLQTGLPTLPTLHSFLGAIASADCTFTRVSVLVTKKWKDP